jgi:hypothetical protein
VKRRKKAINKVHFIVAASRRTSTRQPDARQFIRAIGSNLIRNKKINREAIHSKRQPLDFFFGAGSSAATIA